MDLLISIIIILLVCGMLVWCVQPIPGLPSPVLAAVEIVIVLVCALFLLEHSGLVGRF